MADRAAMLCAGISRAPAPHRARGCTRAWTGFPAISPIRHDLQCDLGKAPTGRWAVYVSPYPCLGLGGSSLPWRIALIWDLVMGPLANRSLSPAFCKAKAAFSNIHSRTPYLVPGFLHVPSWQMAGRVHLCTFSSFRTFSIPGCI